MSYFTLKLSPLISMNKQQKVNLIARRMGTILTTAGIKMIRSAFHINPKKISYDEMRVFLQTETSEQHPNYISLADNYYYVIPWEQWKAIIEVDWTDKKKYLKDRYDCDNYAFLFAARMSEIFDLNTAGVVHGQVNIGHFWNGIVAEGKDKLDLYYYDPMRELWIKHKKGSPIVMNGWTYRPDSYRFF